MNERNFINRKICPCCRSIKYTTIYSCGFLESPVKDYLVSFYAPQGGVELKYLENGTYRLNECADCGLVYQEEILSDLLMIKLYEEWLNPEKVFTLYEKNKTINEYCFSLNEILSVIKHFDVTPSKLKLLDFGMGWGSWCRIAMSVDADVYGSELSKVRIEFAKTYGIKIIGWDEIPQHSFDFINTEQVFEHLPHPLETLKHLKRALKKDGIIKISVPNGADIKSRLTLMDWGAEKNSMNSLNPVAPLEHINCFKHRSLIKMANLAGLTAIDFFSKSITIDGLKTNRESLMTFIKYLLRSTYKKIFLGTVVPETYLFFKHK